MTRQMRALPTVLAWHMVAMVGTPFLRELKGHFRIEQQMAADAGRPFRASSVLARIRMCRWLYTFMKWTDY